MSGSLTQYFPFSNFTKCVKDKNKQEAWLPQGPFPPSNFVISALEGKMDTMAIFLNPPSKKLTFQEN